MLSLSLCNRKMGLRHDRRLFLTESDDSINATLVCKPLCDPLNTSGFCFISCFAICPTVCHYPFPAAAAAIPPPPEYSAFYDADSPSNSHHISPLLITTLVALTLTILLIAAFVLFNYFRRRSSTRRSIIQSHRAAPPPNDEEFLEQGPVLDHPIWYIRTVGLPPSLISKISLCKYKNGDGLVEGTECSVCLTKFEEDETLRLLPKCSHAFHVSCIDTWLRSHTNCPNCRAPIVTNMDLSPSPEPITENLQVIRLDDIGDEDSDDDGLSSREIENTSQDVVTETQVEVEADESEDDRSRNTHVVEQEVNSSTSMLPIRRSVSVDSLSASKIGIAIADFLALRRLESTTTQKDKIRLGEEDQRDNKSSSSSSTGSSSSIKRSLSLSGRFFLSKYSLSRSSVLPR